jgi:uncharacterized membrane-anchored protein YhcB (DUF1043 family)
MNENSNNNKDIDYSFSEGHGSAGIGLWDDSPAPTNYATKDMSQHPSTKWETFKSNFQLAISSDWNLTADAYHGIHWLYDRSIYGPEAAHQYIDSVKNYRKALTETVEQLPDSEQSWTNGFAPKMLGSILDPATIGVAKAASLTVKAIAPEALSSLTAATGLGGSELSTSQKVMKDAIEGGVGGAIGGASTGVVGYSAAKAMDDKPTFGDYLDNVFMWTGMGALGAGLGSAAKNIWFAKDSKPEAAINEEKIDVSKNNVTSQDGLNNAIDTAFIQHGASSSIDGTTSLKASLNDSLDDVTRKQAIHDNMTQNVIESQNLRSPMEQMQDQIDLHKSEIDDHMQSANEILNDIQKQYGDVDLKTSKKFKEDLGGLALTRYAKTMQDLSLLKDLVGKDNKQLNNLEAALKENSYNVGPMSRVRSALNKDPYLVHPEEKQFSFDMHVPENELKELESLKKTGNEVHNNEVQNRIKSLKSFIEKSDTDKIKSKNLSDNLRKLSDISSKLDEANDYHEIAKNKLTTLTGPREDVASSANATANNLNDPMKSFDQDSQGMSLQEMAKDDRPYSELLNDIGKMDETINDLKDQGILSDEDLEQIKIIDDAEQNDEGERSIVKAIKYCILENG